MQKIVIKSKLPTLNEIIAIAKRNPFAYAKMKKDYTNLVRYSSLKLKPIKTPAKFIIKYFLKNKRKDPDNIAVGKKFIFDGLIKAGKIKNDGWQEIAGWEEYFFVDKNERIEITIKEKGEY